jgi:hypothetical protein
LNRRDGAEHPTGNGAHKMEFRGRAKNSGDP